jgi:hypothetical protein
MSTEMVADNGDGDNGEEHEGECRYEWMGEMRLRVAIQQR